ISFTGSQVGIITSNHHTRARILEIKGDRIREELTKGNIVVIAGYQGVSVAKEITTLGRGGSDTTAVALAAALNADKCEIMTDVDGVYTANPQVVPNAKRLAEISYDEMLDLADSGAQILKASAVEFAKRHKIKIELGSSFTGKVGTIITDAKLDRNRVTGISSDENVILVTMRQAGNETVSEVINTLATRGVPVKGFWCFEDHCSFLVVRDHQDTTASILKTVRKLSPDMTVEFDNQVAVLSISGTGINFGTDIMEKVTRIFAELKVKPLTYQLSETRLSFTISKDIVKKAVDKMHNILILDQNR
ncbi:MAG: aspartate kinase, partial [bacterium]